MESRIVEIENYWAAVVRKTDEFQQIALAENPEFNKLGECIRRILQDSFIHDATDYGVRRWETMLNIVPERTDTIEDRKIRILTQLNIQLPYTWRILQQMIASFVGDGNYEMSYINDYSKLNIRIKVNSNNQYLTVLNLLKNVVPQNVVIDLKRLEG